MATDEFTAQLRKQLKFIAASAAAYDAGDLDEGVRIATSVRVILHDTGRSVSILSHLNSKSVPLLSSLSPEQLPAPGAGRFADRATVFTEAGLRPRTHLTRGQAARYVPATEWWEELVYIMDEATVTRGSLVRNAANKDGGAHVDSEIPAEYLQMRSGWQSRTAGAEPVDFAINMSGLRMLAFELLSSPELLNLGECIDLLDDPWRSNGPPTLGDGFSCGDL